MTTALDSIRRQLLTGKECAFLNYAGTAPLPATSAERMHRIVEQARQPSSEHWRDWVGTIERARRSVALAIGAEDDEITFTTNTSTGLSLIAAAVRWRPGDRVLYPADDFPSNRYAWENLAGRYGVKPEAVVIPRGRTLADTLLGRRLDGVRLVALSAVSYRDGGRPDIEAIAAACRAQGALLAIDGAQAVGAVTVDVRAWKCDFLACGGHKWLLGPTGSGFLYLARERIEELHVPVVGWASSRYPGEHGRTLTFCPGARRFEAGLPDPAAITALGHSVDLLAGAGWEVVHGAVAENARRLRHGLRDLGYAVLGEETAEPSGIVTLAFGDPEEASRLGGLLRERRVEVTVRGSELRLAAHGVTRVEEVDALFEALPVRPRRTAATPPAPRSRTARAKATETARRPWRLALVTGASRGLGAALAGGLARRGCGLLLVGRDATALDETASLLRRREGVTVEWRACDLADGPSLDALLAEWQGRPVDVLVNNAALAEPGPCIGDDDHLERTMQANFAAAAALTRAFVPDMLRRRGGAVLNVIAAGARCALPQLGAYAASKAALWAWTEALRRELAGTAVGVTLLVPPHMDSSLQRHLGRLLVGHLKATPPASSASPGLVAEAALTALAAGRAESVPGRTRGLLALNAVAPGFVDAYLRRQWRFDRSADVASASRKTTPTGVH